MKPHKHAELIKAWADGAEIEYMDTTYGCWKEKDHARWLESLQYRIKPEPKPDVVTMLCKKGHSWYELYLTGYLTGSFVACGAWDVKIKLTFDGETGEPKSAEVLK